MSTQRRIAANRRNAKKSTGPKTPAGKAVVALNAIKHGALAALTVIPHVEDDAAWRAHRDGVVAALRPVGLLEARLAERVAALLWRLQRVERFEALSVLAAVAKAEMPPQPGSRPKGLGPLSPDPQPSDEDLARDREERVVYAEEQARRAADALDLLRDLGRKADKADADWEAAETLLRRAGDVLEQVAGVEDPPGPDDGDHLLELMGVPPGTSYDELEWDIGHVRKALALIAGSAEGWDAGKLTEYLAGWLEHDRDRAAEETAKYRGELEDLRARIRTIEACDRVTHLLPAPPVADRVQRYESHLGRQLTQTLRDLERLQAARAGGPPADGGRPSPS